MPKNKIWFFLTSDSFYLIASHIIMKVQVDHEHEIVYQRQNNEIWHNGNVQEVWMNETAKHV